MKINKWKLLGWVFGAIVAVSLLIYLWHCVSPEFAKFVGYLIGGVLAVWQVVASNRRATAAEKTAESMEKGNVDERFKNAIEHLGHKSASVRLGGVYALHHLAQEEENYRKRVFEILCAHIRETTIAKSYKRRPLIPGKNCNEPTVEIQSILNLLFISESGKKIYQGNRADLQMAHLQGANLMEANLEQALILGADLHGALLVGANLKSVTFANVDLNRTVLLGADLEGAYMERALNLDFVNLKSVKTLYRAKISLELAKQIEARNPELFEKPADET